MTSKITENMKPGELYEVETDDAEFFLTKDIKENYRILDLFKPIFLLKGDIVMLLKKTSWDSTFADGKRDAYLFLYKNTMLLSWSPNYYFSLVK